MRAARCLYFCDIDSIKPIDEWELLRRGFLEVHGIMVDKPACTIAPPFGDDAPAFDVLFFDWGGMSIGNSLLEHFCRYIVEDARAKPERLYLMVSDFTARAMRDFESELTASKEELPENVFLDCGAFAAYCKRHGLVRNKQLVMPA